MTPEKFKRLFEELKAVKKDYFDDLVEISATTFILGSSEDKNFAIQIFTNVAPFDDYGDDSHWFPVVINHCETLDDVIDEIRKEFYYIMKFTHADWRAYKKERGLTNKDIAKIVGLTPDSIKNMTQRTKELPSWAVAMLYEWKR